MAADKHPLLFVQMKEGPVDKIVVGRSAARVLVSLLALAAITIAGFSGGAEAKEIASALLMLLKRAFS